MAPVVEARALAMMSNSGKKEVVDQAKRALSRARAAFSQMAAADQDDSTFGYTERQLYFHQGDALVKLGQAMEADLILEQALTKYGPADWLDPTFINFDRATCKLLEGDLDEALSIAKLALAGLADGCRPDILMQRAHEVAKAVEAKDPGHPELKVYQEALRTPPVADPAEVDI